MACYAGTGVDTNMRGGSFAHRHYVYVVSVAVVLIAIVVFVSRRRKAVVMVPHREHAFYETGESLVDENIFSTAAQMVLRKG